MTFADYRPQTAGCRLQDCKLNETKNIAMTVASLSTLPCSQLLTKWEAKKRSLYFPCKLHPPHSREAVGCTPGESINSRWRIANRILEMKPVKFCAKNINLVPRLLSYLLRSLEKMLYFWWRHLRRFLVSFNLQSAACSLQSAVCGLWSAVCKCHTPRSGPRFCRLYSVSEIVLLWRLEHAR